MRAPKLLAKLQTIRPITPHITKRGFSLTPTQLPLLLSRPPYLGALSRDLTSIPVSLHGSQFRMVSYQQVEAEHDHGCVNRITDSEWQASKDSKDSKDSKVTDWVKPGDSSGEKTKKMT